MKKRTTIISIICGLLCAACVGVYTTMVQRSADAARNEAIERYGGEQIEVLVASRDIYPGEGIDSSNTERKLWVASLLPADALTSFDQAIGRQLSSTVLKGEVVSSKRFDSEAMKIDIPEGMVALSVPAKEIQALGGAIEVGSRVDVYATGSKTTCLGEQVQVLATSVSGSEGSQGGKISWVTLAVEPERAQEYVVASQQMELYFTLPSTKRENDQTPDDQVEESASPQAQSQEGTAPVTPPQNQDNAVSEKGKNDE